METIILFLRKQHFAYYEGGTVLSIRVIRTFVLKKILISLRPTETLGGLKFHYTQELWGPVHRDKFQSMPENRVWILKSKQSYQGSNESSRVWNYGEPKTPNCNLTIILPSLIITIVTSHMLHAS